AAERLPEPLEAVGGRRLVDVEQEVDVRVAVGVAAGAGAREARRPEGAERLCRGHRALRQLPHVLRRAAHLATIVDWASLTDDARTYEAAGVSLATADAVVDR